MTEGQTAVMALHFPSSALSPELCQLSRHSADILNLLQETRMKEQEDLQISVIAN